MIVYVATGPTGGQYVGICTRNLRYRKNAHRYQANKGTGFKFHDALRQYGFESFSWEVVETCSDIEALLQAEARWISQLDSLKNGYNATAGGQGCVGRAVSDGQRKAHGEKIRALGAEHRKRVSDGLKRAHREDPMLRERLSLKTKEYAARFPHLLSERSKKVCADPAFRQRVSLTLKDWYKSNPGELIAMSRRVGGSMVEASKNGETITFQTQAQCAREIGVSASNLSACLSGRIKSLRGYTFRRIGTEAGSTDSADFESRDIETLADSALCGFSWASIPRISLSNSAQMLESTG